MNRTLIATALLAAAVGASAQTTVVPTGGTSTTSSVSTAVQRDENQQQRIQSGLQSGSLSTTEAARLERQEAAVNALQSRELRDGTLSAKDTARLDAAQDRVSRDIYNQKHDAQTGNPTSVSSLRQQTEVQRNINQDQRVQAGVANGTLNNREVARVERGEARNDYREYRGGRDGYVSARNENHVNAGENRTSNRIWTQKHDNQMRRR